MRWTRRRGRTSVPGRRRNPRRLLISLPRVFGHYSRYFLSFTPMRAFFLAGLFAIVGVAKSDEPDQAKAVVDRAIAAIGGEEKLRDLKGGVWKTSGVFQGKQSRAE